jgi:hypothetical protein
MNKLIEKLKNCESGINIYSVTPPVESISEEKLVSMNKRRSERIASLGCDAISIYDVQEEKLRNREKRTYEFRAAMNPLLYGTLLKNEIDMPQIIYLAAGKYTKSELLEIFSRNRETAFVLVGSPSRETAVKTSLKEAYEIAALFPNPMGGVLIGERHQNGMSEVRRVLEKTKRGAGFFISQCIYDGQLYEKFLKDYAGESQFLQNSPKPVFLTFSPVGNKSGLQFMEWLGVQIPQNFRNNLPESDDFMEYTVNYLEKTARKLIDLSLELNIPLGLNFESVIGKRAEVLASFELARRLREYRNKTIPRNDYFFSNSIRYLNSRVPALSSR